MSHGLNARTNSDMPVPTTKDDVFDEAHRVDTDATPGESNGRHDGQVAVADPESGSAHLEQGPGDVAATAETTAVGEQSRPEQVYQERMPSDATISPVTTIWPENVVNDLRTRWQAVQLRFVDDPAAVTGEMQTLVGEAVQAVSAALAGRQRELDDWSRSGHDTEQLRFAVQRYRDFYEFLLAW